MKATKRGAAGFTLIELLVVIVIIGVLFAVALVVFGNAGRKNTERSAELLMVTMRLAHQHAISQRQWTLVVFPNRDGGAYAGEEIEKCLRGYAVLAVVNNMDGMARADQIPSNMEFAFVTDWKTLPQGIYFDDDPALNGNYLFGAKNGVDPAYTANFQFPMDPAHPNVLVRPMGAVLFKPNGRAYVMNDGNKNGNFWQDVDRSKVYVTAAKTYDHAEGVLTGPTLISGKSTVVQIRNKTGQVQIWDGSE